MLQMEIATGVAMLVHSGPQNVKRVVANQPNAGMKIQTMNILFLSNMPLNLYILLLTMVGSIALYLRTWLVTIGLRLLQGKNIKSLVRCKTL